MKSRIFENKNFTRNGQNYEEYNLIHLYNSLVLTLSYNTEAKQLY